jgi:hypothetical protein
MKHIQQLSTMFISTLFFALARLAAIQGWVMIPQHHRLHQRNQYHHRHHENIITIGQNSFRRNQQIIVVEGFLRSSTTPSQQQPQPQNSIQKDSLPDTSRPLPPHTFGGMVETALIERFGEKDVERILISWRLLDQEYYRKEYVGDNSDYDVSMSSSTILDGQPTQQQQQQEQQEPPLNDSNMIQECHSYVPGLSVRPFWDPIDFDWAKYLESQYPAIRKEFDAVTANMQQLQQDGNNVWAGALTDDAASYGEDWKTLVLLDRGRWDPINANLFPITASKLCHLFFFPFVVVSV